MTQSSEKIKDARNIWNWAKTLVNLRESNDYFEKQVSLMKICKENLLSDFYADEYCFPSKMTEKFADDYINFTLQRPGNFNLVTLLDKIWANLSYINEESVNALLIMLIDVSLYRAFVIVKELSHSRFFYQLNMCVILDAMIIKPDKGVGSDVNIVSLLGEVSEKAKLRIDSLNTKTIWTLAMLNYKVHLYDSSVTFFEKYIVKNSKSKEQSIQLRIYHARIYIGYCYEKSENFDEAIRLFQNTLSELVPKAETNEEYQNLIRELDHGLGHFYNERAVFGKVSEQSEDIISKDILNARYHMVDALSKKVDYYSCYGSLFHECGDYKTAQNIFDEASQNPDIIANDELLNELKFYIAQTGASVATDEDEKVNQEFKQFEDYCVNTFNYDGIVHARIFKIRTFLRRIYFSSNHIFNRERILKKIENWHKELTEYSLSSYASKSIKKEYKKILYVLNIFRSLYADSYFEWHTEDLRFNFQKYLVLMPKDALKLDYSPKDVSSKESNLYQIALGDLWIWCVGSKLLSNEQVKKILSDFGRQINAIVPVLDKHSAHVSIQKNWKPDLVILIPPTQKDIGFEHEIEAIKNSVSELYFVYCIDSAGLYNNEWFETNISSQGMRYTCYAAHNVLDALVHAYCLRAFEILRKELLRPIPLFSLAPTHFSASYDFQLGESLDICFDCINEHNTDSRNLRESLSFIDNKYSKNWLNKMVHRAKMFPGPNDCTSGIMHICCPAPLSLIGVDNYIGYYMDDPSVLEELRIPHKIKPRERYTLKALPSYQEVFWDLEEALRYQGNPCQHDEEDVCTVFCGDSLLSVDESSNIPNLCRNILRVIFNENIEQNSELDRPFKCILKKSDEVDNPRECFIYITLLECSYSHKVEKGVKSYCPLRSEINMKKDVPPTVFVTYSWEKPSDSSDKNAYLIEVRDFVKKLRDNGYPATFDLELYKKTHNWTDIMIQGLQMDKVIVLLSKEYKRKADDWEKETGVKFESHALVERFKRDRQNIILAKLPSQHDTSVEELRPICFSGENVIDLSSSELTNGYNLLWLSLNNQSPTGDSSPVNSKITTGRTME